MASVEPEFIALAHQLADAAGDVLRRHYRTALSAARKADLSPVTQADRETETAMRNLIEAGYPDHGIVGEEFGSVRPDATYQWVLDPIDGTRSFIAGYPLFTTLIALTYQSVPVLGIIDQPILKERWLGITGQPTTLNGTPVKSRESQTLAQAVIATTSADYFTPVQAVAFARTKNSCANTIFGGDAYAYAMLASGQIDLVLDAGMKPYDYCAVAPIIAGAGGMISDWQGQSLSLTSDGSVLAAASRELHQQAFNRLQTKA